MLFSATMKFLPQFFFVFPLHRGREAQGLSLREERKSELGEVFMECICQSFIFAENNILQMKYVIYLKRILFFKRLVLCRQAFINIFQTR